MIMKMIDCGLLECFTNLLDTEDPRIPALVMTGFENMLKSEPWMVNCNQICVINPVLVELEKKDGRSKLEKLTWHSDPKVQRQAQELLEKLFEN